MTAGNTQSKQERCACVIAVAIIMFFFITIIIRTLTRQVLVKRLGMENSFTEFVLFDVDTLNTAGEDESSASVDIDWAKLYPFKNDSDSFAGRTGAGIKEIRIGLVDEYRKRIQSAEDNVEVYATDFLIGYNKIVELSNRYEDAIQWNIAPYAEYNGIIQLSDGHLTSYISKADVSGAADNLIDFAEYCRLAGIAFFYAQAPYKISGTQDTTVSGVLDFSNQNADALIERLRCADVDVYDFREIIQAEGLDHHSLFYRTDHHWRAETGLWAARHILEYLHQEYGFTPDSAALSSDRFTSVLYPSWFLGSHGKKVTLSVTTPDDFSLYYPTYHTKMHFSIPDVDIDLDGDFSIVYDMSRVQKADYYRQNPYAAYIYGDHALVRFENHLAGNEIRLLFINDSFGNCVLPFLALGVKHIDSLDIRCFTGSVHSFIDENKPDAVIVLYNPSSVNNEGESHKATFDCR